jgi:uncharacterized protein (TIGR02611 family)
VAVENAGSRRERTMARLRERKEVHKQRSRVYRVSFAVVGFALILLGLILVPLPGPGWLIVAIGVGMLALEFDRAERLLERLLHKLENAAEMAGRAPAWQKALGLVVASAVGIGVLAAALLLELPYVPG